MRSVLRTGPGLVGALLVGVAEAKAIAYAKKRNRWSAFTILKPRLGELYRTPGSGAAVPV